MACQNPMSCPVNKNPPHPPSSSIRNSISTPLSGTKWRKNLTRLSRKLTPGSRYSAPLSGTAAAAATEKLIRRPKTTIQTEDLTASQFASMAGIKIKRGRNHQDSDTLPQQHMGLGEYEETDDDDTDDDDDDYSNDDSGSDTNTHGMLPVSLDQRQIRQLTTKVTKANPGSVTCMTSYSSLSSSTATTTTTNTTRYHPIWDARFWQHQNQQQQQQEQHQQQQKKFATKHQPKQKQQRGLSGDNKQQQQQHSRPFGQEKSIPPPGYSAISSTGRYSDLSANDTLSSSTSSTLDTCFSTNLSSAKPRVLHKGRFQIVLGDDDTIKPTSEPLVRSISSDSRNNVVEWHRKRAMTQ